MNDLPKRMLVWDEHVYKCKRIVLAITKEGRPVCVASSTEESFNTGHKFNTIVWDHCEEIAEKRPMTRLEIMGFVLNTSGIIARYNQNEWNQPSNLHFTSGCGYQWATIDADGNIGEPQEFVK